MSHHLSEFIRRRLALTSIVVAIGLFSGAAQDETRLAWEDVGFDLCTTYYWRGYQVVDHPTLQPTATVTWGEAPVSLNAWGSLTLADHNNHQATDEVDLTLTTWRNLSWGDRAIDLSAGATLYNFPSATKGARRSAEAMVVAELGGTLSPALRGYYDFDQWDAGYVSLSFAPEIAIGPNHSLAISPWVGFGDWDQDFGFQDAGATLGSTFAWQGLAITPAVGAARASRAVNADRGLVWGTLSLRFAE
ncbi:MAG: hypothetical protein U0527_03775 [Candidatus Eisenbacteria bacterium]